MEVFPPSFSLRINSLKLSGVIMEGLSMHSLLQCTNSHLVNTGRLIL